MKNMAGVALLFFLLSADGFASRKTPISPQALHQRSDVIVLASVKAVASRGDVDHVTLQVSSVLEGTSTAKTYSLTLSPRGLTGFDPELKVGDIGVFFLKVSPQSGRIQLAHWGAVARFRKGDVQHDPPN